MMRCLFFYSCIRRSHIDKSTNNNYLWSFLTVSMYEEAVLKVDLLLLNILLIWNLKNLFIAWYKWICVPDENLLFADVDLYNSYS